ncbi:hypothetical protein PINS_up004697 [Pythium insidiosum]|nr:hypothetical protein PINS_up004697 [Pythium insidiosum]
MLLASGQSALETTSRQALITAVAADPELASWSRQTSYRVVRRADVEASLRLLHEERIRAEMEAAHASRGGEESESPTAPVEAAPVVVDVALTPETLAQGFQRLVADDKRAFLSAATAPPDGEPPEASTSSQSNDDFPPPARVFLLTDYPATLSEVHALLSLGELDREVVSGAGSKPLLPLIDGVIVVLDTLRELRERRRSLSQSTNGDDRRKSISRRVDGDLKDLSLDRSVTAGGAFQYAGAFVKELLATSMVGALEWSDFVFTDLPCCSSVTETKPATDLVRDLAAALETLGAQKAAFKEWVASVQIRQFPSVAVSDDRVIDEIHVAYSRGIESVYSPCATVAVVIACMRDAVAAVIERSADLSAKVEFHSNSNSNNDDNDATPEPFMEHGDTAAIRLAIAYDLFSRSLDDTDSDQSDADVTVSASVCCVDNGDRVDSLEKRMWRTSDLPGVGNAGRKWFPRAPRLSVAERLVQDAELTTFTPSSISLRHIHLMQQLLRFEEILGGPWKGRLRARAFVEHLSQDVLPQRLAELVRESPHVVRDYDESQDALLVAIHNATAPGRFRTMTWSAKDHVRHRPTFKDWKRELPFPPEYLTPRTELARTACVPLSSGELSVVAEKSSLLYPSDQSIVRLFQWPTAPAWLTVTLDGCVGCRRRWMVTL